MNSSAYQNPSSHHLEHQSSNVEIMIGLRAPLPEEALDLDIREITRIAPDQWPENLRQAILPKWKDNKGVPLPTEIPMCDLTGNLNYRDRIVTDD